MNVRSAFIPPKWIEYHLFGSDRTNEKRTEGTYIFMQFHDSLMISHSFMDSTPIHFEIGWNRQQFHLFLSLSIDKWIEFDGKNCQIKQYREEKKVCVIGKRSRDIAVIPSHRCCISRPFFCLNFLRFCLAGYRIRIDIVRTESIRDWFGKTVWMAEWSGATNCTIKNNCHAIKTKQQHEKETKDNENEYNVWRAATFAVFFCACCLSCGFWLWDAYSFGRAFFSSRHSEMDAFELLVNRWNDTKLCNRNEWPNPI